MGLDVRLEVVELTTVYDANITHNLTEMAEAADIYRALWRPEEIDIRFAYQLIEPLSKGLSLLKSDPIKFKKLNPPNGWGNYDGLVKFIEDYIVACVENPTAIIKIDR